MEDDMFRRIEHKPRKKASDEKSIDGEPSQQPPIEEEHHSVIFETHTDDPSPSEIRMEVSVPSEDREPARDRTRSEQTPPEKRTAVEVIFGPNNRKKRKEAARMERQVDTVEPEGRKNNTMTVRGWNCEGDDPPLLFSSEFVVNQQGERCHECHHYARQSIDVEVSGGFVHLPICLVDER